MSTMRRHFVALLFFATCATTLHAAQAPSTTKKDGAALLFAESFFQPDRQLGLAGMKQAVDTFMGDALGSKITIKYKANPDTYLFQFQTQQSGERELLQARLRALAKEAVEADTVYFLDNYVENVGAAAPEGRQLEVV